MAEKPAWMDYADLTAKVAVPILVPVSIFFATMKYNGDQGVRHAGEVCIDLQMKLFGAVCADKDCTISPPRAGLLLGLDELISKQCEIGGVKPAPQIKIALKKAGQSSTDLADGAALQRAGGAAAPVKVSTPGPAPALADATQKAPTPVGGALQIFVQVEDPSQVVGARALIARLEDSTVGSRSIVAHGPDLVPGVHITRTEVRCLKHADCSTASDIATYLSGLLGTPIAVRDVSPTYENNPKARAGVFELWFAPGEISMGTPSVAQVATPAPPPSPALESATVSFAPGAGSVSNLSAADQQVLQGIAQSAAQRHAKRVTVTAYDTGLSLATEASGKYRAKAVASRLAELGVAPAIIETKWFGRSAAMAMGRPSNQRKVVVEVSF